MRSTSIHSFLFSNKWLLVFLLLGTFVRLLFGLHTQLWNGAPDQLAWQLTLDDALQNELFSYKQLIHYPNEGGSIVLSSIALLLKQVQCGIPGLSLTALLVDTLGRLIQVVIVRKIFGEKVALYFAVWTVFSVPLLLSWSVVNFGLHHIASFSPFIYLLLLFRPMKPHSPWLFGLFCGLSLAFSYDNSVVVLAVGVVIISGIVPVTNKLAFLAKFGLATVIAFLPHLAFRLFLDNGFHLGESSSFLIRDLNFSHLITWHGGMAFVEFWYKPLPASFFLGGVATFYQKVLHVLVILFLLFSLYKTIKQWRKMEGLKPLIVMIVCFFLLYLLSPFYEKSGSLTSYVSYRHLSYILPAIVLWMIYVLLQRTAGTGDYFAKAWIILCIAGSGVFMWTAQPVKSVSYKETGWILARKFGDDPELLNRIRNRLPLTRQKEIMVGYGWGITTALFRETKNERKSVLELKAIIDHFPKEYRKDVLTGVDFAFSPGITPVLKASSLKCIRQEMGD